MKRLPLGRFRSFTQLNMHFVCKTFCVKYFTGHNLRFRKGWLPLGRYSSYLIS